MYNLIFFSFCGGAGAVLDRWRKVGVHTGALQLLF